MPNKDQWRLGPRVNHHHDKHTVPRSLRKQPDVTIILSCIPEGVQVKVDLLGYVEKIKYSNHDLMDTDKFLKCANKV
jgi:hypothetical protein